MNWEQTIQFIRTKEEFKNLVEKAYFEENLALNVERFKKSEEFEETLFLLKHYAPNAKRILDIGSGNGISAVSFAIEGYEVVSVEPDSSTTIGSGAIIKLKNEYGLKNLQVHESYAENMHFDRNSFDIVYCRQCMHHADNLQKFVKEAYRVLVKGGLFITVRDHVIYGSKDKELFLKSHPLQKYYGGENAFTLKEYQKAFKNAGFKTFSILRHYDSVINYYSMSIFDKDSRKLEFEKNLVKLIDSKFPRISKFKLFNFLIKYLFEKKYPLFDERKIPGRMYSFLNFK